MISSRGLRAVPIILLSALLADALAQSNPEKARKPEAKAILDKVRDTYRNLAGYHFERILLVQEAREDGKLANIAELSLTIATEDAKPAPEPFPPINLGRFRLGTKTNHGELLQVCDGQTCWSYTSLKNEYMTGSTFRDVNTSVGGSMMMAFHLFTFSTLEEGTVQDVKMAGQEVVQVGKERRKCLVFEAEIQMPPLLGPGGPKPPSIASLGAFWLVSALTLQGLTEGGMATRYSPWLDDKAPGVAEPTRITLWIDENGHVIVRSKMAAQLYKRTVGTEQAVEKVAVIITDSFTTAAVEAPPDDVFRFTPPEGAKEVPNVASRREKK
jgi:hypothetical protein